ncbi:MAG: DUF4124 domain-containing protein [Massilia sp.]
MHRSLPYSLRVAAGALLLCCAHVASAQYLWVDAKGVKQFSDRPPPADVPLKHILRAPKGQQSVATVEATEKAAAADAAAAAALAASGPAPSPAPSGAKPLSLAERNADFMKRQKEKGEADKKDREEKERNMAKDDACERMRSARASLDNSRRIRTTDKNGEPGYMDDEQRALEAKRLDKALSSCTKA